MPDTNLVTEALRALADQLRAAAAGDRALAEHIAAKIKTKPSNPEGAS